MLSLQHFCLTTVMYVVDLMLFMLLAIVVLLPYGVAAQSLLYPNAEPSWNILYNFVDHPCLSILLSEDSGVAGNFL